MSERPSDLGVVNGVKIKSQVILQLNLRKLAELCLSLKYQAEFKRVQNKKTTLLRDYSSRVSARIWKTNFSTIIVHKITHLFIFIGPLITEICIL